MKFRLILSFLTLCIICSAEEYKTINCVLHVHSMYSGTRYTMEEIVKLAKETNIDVVVLTDHYLQQVEFGLWPFREILKTNVNLPSVMKLGLEKYLNEINNINNLQKDVLLIPGIEITPHYFWSTSYETNELIINNLHKHMILISEDKNLYLNLPVIGNENVRKFKLLSLWPIIILLLGFFLKSKITIIISIILLAANYPFEYYQFNQYRNYTEQPYQNLINYINEFNQKQNSDYIIIWAHPEAPNYEKKFFLKNFKKLKIYTQTKTYPESLLKTSNYDGFSIFAEGCKKVGSINGLWDYLLTEYCKGKIKKPAWCYSELDFGETKDNINVRKNVLYVKEKNYQNIISALKNGNFYSLWCNEEEELILKNFKFCGKEILFGTTNKINDEVISLNFEIIFSNNKNLLTKIHIIRNNNTVFQKEAETPVKINFKEPKPKEKSYYRIYVESKYPHKLATNPIFIE